MYHYYVHYNGWSSSHDEWMREDVLDPLLPEERRQPEALANPPPSRSSKSNHLIYDPSVSDRVIQNLLQQKDSGGSPRKQAPLSPSSPAAAKKPGRKPLSATSVRAAEYHNNFTSSSTSEEEEAASELMELEYFSALAQQSRNRSDVPARQTTTCRPTQQQPLPPAVSYPIRSDPGLGIAKIVQDKRDRPHEQDLIHCNRLHTHPLNLSHEDNENERQMVAKLLSSIKMNVTRDEVLQGLSTAADSQVRSAKTITKQTDLTPVCKEALEDPRSLEDIHESLINLQSSLLSMQSQFKHTMKALKKHHNITQLPPAPLVQKKTVSTRRSGNH